MRNSNLQEDFQLFGHFLYVSTFQPGFNGDFLKVRALTVLTKE